MKKQILNNQQIEQKINRMAYEMLELYMDKELVLVGIEPRGNILADRITAIYNTVSKTKAESISLQIDKENPYNLAINEQLLSKVKNKNVVIVDDVLNSGKTIMYALKPFLQIELKNLGVLVLVDRDHKQYPVFARFVGMSLSTTLNEHISVEFNSGNDAAYLL
ncbi:MAG: phosphoribosyltransferase family protein [Bacteroidota bacterium]|jgi:pyrimidine operon attenuation protein/uracil phosphoribosyltransferase